MIVLQIAAYAADFEGNFIKSLKEIENQLKIVGDCVVYAFPITAKNKAWMEAFCKERRVYFLPLKKARVSRSAYKLVCQIVKDEKVDVVHSHFELYDMHASYAAKKIGAKVLWHLHDPLPLKDRFSRKLLRKLQYKLYGKKALMTSVCQYYGEQAVKEGMPSDNVVTILNGIDTSFIVDATGSKKNYEFFTIGWDFLRKGGDIVLTACERLREEEFSFSLLFCGNEQTWGYLDERYQGNDPDWLTRKEPVADINTLYGESKAFISASRRETFSYAVCEAIYAGLPVISTDIAGLEWTQNIPTVLHMEADSVEELTTNMRSLLNADFAVNKEDYLVAKKMIAEEFSATCWAKKIIQMYR